VTGGRAGTSEHCPPTAPGAPTSTRGRSSAVLIGRAVVHSRLQRGCVPALDATFSPTAFRLVGVAHRPGAGSPVATFRKRKKKKKKASPTRFFSGGAEGVSLPCRVGFSYPGGPRHPLPLAVPQAPATFTRLIRGSRDDRDAAFAQARACCTRWCVAGCGTQLHPGPGVDVEWWWGNGYTGPQRGSGRLRPGHRRRVITFHRGRLLLGVWNVC